MLYADVLIASGRTASRSVSGCIINSYVNDRWGLTRRDITCRRDNVTPRARKRARACSVIVCAHIGRRHGLIGSHARIVLAGGLVLPWLEGRSPLVGSHARIILAGGLFLPWLEGRSPLLGSHARIVLAGGLVLPWLEGRLPLLGSLGRKIAPLPAQRDALPGAIF